MFKIDFKHGATRLVIAIPTPVALAVLMLLA